MVFSSRHRASSATPNVAGFMNRESAVVRTSSYDSVFISRYDRRIDSLLFIDREYSGVKCEPLNSFTGTPPAEIRNGDTETCIYPEDHAHV